jgi:hypothetical protein
MCRGTKIIRLKKGTFVRIFSPLVYFIKSDQMVPLILILYYFYKKSNTLEMEQYKNGFQVVFGSNCSITFHFLSTIVFNTAVEEKKI